MANLPFGPLPQRAPDDYTPSRRQMAMLPNADHPGSGCSCEACIRHWPEELPGEALVGIESQSDDCPAETRAELHRLRRAASQAASSKEAATPLQEAAERIEVERDRMFGAMAVIGVASRAINIEDDCDLHRLLDDAYKQLDSIALTLNGISCDVARMEVVRA